MGGADGSWQRPRLSVGIDMGSIRDANEDGDGHQYDEYDDHDDQAEGGGAAAPLIEGLWVHVAPRSGVVETVRSGWR